LMSRIQTCSRAIRVHAVVAVFLGIIAGIGCSGPRMMRLSDRRYEPRPPSFPIELYEGNVKTAHEELAIIDSIAVEQLTTQTRKALVEDLRSRAREVGAGAVKNVTMLIRADRGWIEDPQTPFHSWRQGWTDRYFLRGRAIRFKPLLIEPGAEAVGAEPFAWAEGERPSVRAESAPQLEVYEVKDPYGRQGYAARRVIPPKRKLPTIEAGD